MNKNSFYSVVSEIGTFADESAFKKKFMSIIKDNKKKYKCVLAIENSVEPGMPDLLIIDQKDKATFVEVKYAKRGVISFKKTQIPWYCRHKDLAIVILAYNDITRNIHVIDVEIILSGIWGTTYKLQHEDQYELRYLS